MSSVPTTEIIVHGIDIIGTITYMTVIYVIAKIPLERYFNYCGMLCQSVAINFESVPLVEQ